MPVKESTEVVTRCFPPGETIPNNPALPVVVLRQAFAPAPPGEVCAMLERNGWVGTWVSSVFDYHHYHPDAHEALAVAQGTARIQLGGPGGEAFDVRAGDCLVLPAGTGHCRLSQSDDFRICGAYPPGQEGYTISHAGPQAARDAAVVAAVPLPNSDPILGGEGPLPGLWEGVSRR